MGRYLELIRGRFEAVQGSSNPQIPQKSVSPHTVGEETGVGSGSVVSCEKSELSELRGRRPMMSDLFSLISLNSQRRT